MSLEELKKEIERAESKFPEYSSPHEGYAIIEEEFCELWDEVRKSSHDYREMKKEALHVACTAMRFIKMCEKNIRS